MYGWDNEEDQERQDMGMSTFYHLGKSTDRYLSIINKNHKNRNENSTQTKDKQVGNQKWRDTIDKQVKTERSTVSPQRQKKERLKTQPNPQQPSIFQVRCPSRTFLALKYQDLLSNFKHEQKAPIGWDQKCKEKCLIRSRLSKLRERMIKIEKGTTNMNRLNGRNITPLQTSLVQTPATQKQTIQRSNNLQERQERPKQSLLPIHKAMQPQRQSLQRLKRKGTRIYTNELITSISTLQQRSHRQKPKRNGLPFVRKLKINYPLMYSDEEFNI